MSRDNTQHKDTSVSFFTGDDLNHTHFDLKRLAEIVVVKDISYHEWRMNDAKFQLHMQERLAALQEEEQVAAYGD